ncbi:uncharacterized protein LOC119470915 [Cebus imitator]|uniref:uncharacterized protein LOC119470915 n=1 Tax=Cebus imitator TaxID=2715852 RepID=UPI001897505E|nr:uncharacterized protein LOC119470915 [Cebus imitator]
MWQSRRGSGVGRRRRKRREGTRRPEIRRCCGCRLHPCRPSVLVFSSAFLRPPTCSFAPATCPPSFRSPFPPHYPGLESEPGGSPSPTSRRSRDHAKVDPAQPSAALRARDTAVFGGGSVTGSVRTLGSARPAGSTWPATAGRGGARSLRGLPNPLEGATASKWFESGPLVFSRSKTVEQIDQFCL